MMMMIIIIIIIQVSMNLMNRMFKYLLPIYTTSHFALCQFTYVEIE